MAEEQPPAVPAGDRSVQLGIGTLIIIALIVTQAVASAAKEAAPAPADAAATR